jgi:hypothetical protein
MRIRGQAGDRIGTTARVYFWFVAAIDFAVWVGCGRGLWDPNLARLSRRLLESAAFRHKALRESGILLVEFITIRR